MLKKEKSMNNLIFDALTESELYLDMYNEKLKKCEEKLKDLEDNKEKHNLTDFEFEKNNCLKEIEKYKQEIRNEKDSIKRLQANQELIEKK